MFEAKVYHIAVSTLGTILQEEYIAKETIQKWNTECAEKAGKLFLYVPEESRSIPDLYIVIINSYVETAKVEKLIATGRSVMLFFSKYHDPRYSIQAEIDKVDAFKETVKNKCICVDYCISGELKEMLFAELSK